LKPRAGVKPLPWQGRLARSGVQVDYRLSPTQPAMYDALLTFLRAEFGARDAASSTGSADGPQSKALAIDGRVFHVGYRADNRTTSLYADAGLGAPALEAYALVERIGARFNETLARGRHQDLFAEFPPGK
jgi:hypothetical protein